MLPRAGGLNGRRGRKRPRSGPVPLGCYVSRHSPAPSPAPGTPRTYGGNKRTPLPATPIMQRTLAATPSSAVATPAAAKAAAAAAAATATIANTRTKKQRLHQEAQPPGVLGLQGTSLASSPHSGRGEFAPLCPACQNPNRDIITGACALCVSSWNHGHVDYFSIHPPVHRPCFLCTRCSPPPTQTNMLVMLFAATAAWL